MDEFSPCGPTRVVELTDGQISTYEVTPTDFGIEPVEFERVASRESARANADAVLSVLKSEYESPAADFFCMNAGAALYSAGKAADYADGLRRARDALAAGKALEKLEQLLSVQGRPSR